MACSRTRLAALWQWALVLMKPNSATIATTNSRKLLKWTMLTNKMLTSNLKSLPRLLAGVVTKNNSTCKFGMQLGIHQRHRFSQVSGDSIPKNSKTCACDMPPDFETCFSRQAWKSARAHRPATGSKAKQAGRHQIDHYLVASGSMAWSGCGPQHLDRKEDVVFMPLQIERTTGLFLMAGLEMCFQQSIGSLKTFEDSASKFGLLQFLTVADAAPANVSMLGKLFSWLQDLNSTYSSAHPEQEASLLLACFVPCLLHQLSRVLVLNLERQQLTNKLFCVTRLVQQTPLRKSLIRVLVAEIGGMAWHLLQQFFRLFHYILAARKMKLKLAAWICCDAWFVLAARCISGHKQ